MGVEISLSLREEGNPYPKVVGEGAVGVVLFLVAVALLLWAVVAGVGAGAKNV